MADCELLQTCEPFYEKLASMPSTARLMRGAFCRWNFAECARYRIHKALGTDKVPLDLYPSDASRAAEMMK